MAEAVDIPETPEALSAEWLAEHLGWPVRSARREMLGEGQGFLGDIVRLHLDSGEADAPGTVVAKLPKKANRAMGEMMGVYEREVLFFQELGAGFPVRIPQIYFSHFDPDAGSARQKEILGACDGLPRLLMPAVSLLGRKIAGLKKRRYLLIMEDLARFRPGDQLEGADVETCAQVLEAFAAAHAQFWERDDLGERFWLLPLDIDAHMREHMYRHTLAQFQAEASTRLRPYVSWLGDHYARLARTLTDEAPTTLIHTDLRLDNVCFDGAECAFLDWQLVRSGPAAYDVAYFLGGALAEEATADEEDYVLERYHRALGRDDYAFERFRRDYHRGLLLSLAAVAPFADIAIDPGRGQSMMARWRGRLEARLQRVDVDRALD